MIDWNQMKENENLMSNGIQYIDSIVITINLNIFASIPERYLCQKSSDEIVDNT